MNNHVWRPLFVVIFIFFVLMVIRHFVVPADFRTGDKGFMYSYHRIGNEVEWENFKVKYRSKAYCADCHDEYGKNMSSPHKIIECENCHGPAVDHPDDPEKLPIDRSRELCLRCHAKLPYPTSLRSEIRGIDPENHYPKAGCFTCHNPHHPNLAEMTGSVTVPSSSPAGQKTAAEDKK
jgi:hypothetical protein